MRLGPDFDSARAIRLVPRLRLNRDLASQGNLIEIPYRNIRYLMA